MIASLLADNEGCGHAERALTACCCWFVFNDEIILPVSTCGFNHTVIQRIENTKSGRQYCLFLDM